MNAYEDGDSIVLDVARFQKMAFGPEDKDGTPSLLHRWVIDTTKRTVRDIPLDDRPADFPRIADAKVGLKHRFGYMTGLGGDIANEFGSQLIKYDLESGKSEAWASKSGGAGEPVFVQTGRNEDDGYVLTFVYDGARGASDLVILDAKEFAKGPIARVHLPVRVPYGFHGSWIAD
jgi:carotenoid cleavage dioxygenase